MNTNCLEGIRCPECGSYGPFGIGTHCSAIVHDDGVEETSGHEWDKFSPITCQKCDHDGAVGDFTVSGFHLNEYEIDRAYGGPQEGGWWYDTGRFVKCHGRFPTQDEADKARDGLQNYLAEKREGLHEPSSVLSEGEWPELYVEDHEGRDYPQHRPFYE